MKFDDVKMLNLELTLNNVALSSIDIKPKRIRIKII